MIKKLDLHLKYDQMVLSRADYIYAAMPFHPIAKFGPKVVWVPAGEEYGEFTDRYLAASSEVMLLALKIFKFLPCESEKALMRCQKRKRGVLVEPTTELRWKGVDGLGLNPQVNCPLMRRTQDPCPPLSVQ